MVEEPTPEHGRAGSTDDHGCMTVEEGGGSGESDSVDRYLVGLDSMRTLPRLGHGSDTIVRRYDFDALGPAVVVKLTETDAQHLAASPGIRYVEKDRPRYPVVLG